jgi:5-methylcytosine-specific restriction endonuclease McrBC GTP-binding regulatory subunit McrB
LDDRLEINKEKRDKIIDFEFIKDKFKEKYQLGEELETFKSQSKFKIEKYTENSLRIRPLNSEYVFSISFDYLEEAFNKNLEKEEDIVNIIGMPKGLSTYYRSVYGKLMDIYNTEVKHKSESERKTVSNPDEISNENKTKLVKDFYNRRISLKENVNDSKPYVLIIDEINRGNISKIFGELITLIEEDKRESFSVRLPYSHEEFTVPKNLYIIGTMNTSDRSIASIDIALRRRFTFKEMMPDKNRVTEEIKENNTTIKLQNIFNTLNKRISVLLDRDHQIGHSYFMNVKCIDDLKKVWFNSIMPLLNEYFYNDWEKLQALLGKAKLADDNHKYPSFVKKIEKVDFADSDYQCDENEQYDFVSDTEIDFEKALENAFTKQIEYKEKE